MLIRQAKFCFKWTHIPMWLLVVPMLLSCKDDKRPDGILTEPQMVEVLRHMYLSEERLNQVAIPYDSMGKLLPYVKSKVYEQAGVSDSLFRVSMQYYMAHPKQLEYIYTALVDSLGLEEQGRPHEIPKNVQSE
ncbi:MAG: DUF4296 domain-containing protein [Cyclobacteriaceae bacterium]|nr:MAG: DUF4296 domain-containing protein [Cyclobacteriaceae bacterium]